MKRFLALLTSCAVVGVLLGCAARSQVRSADEPSPKFAGTSYYEAGGELFISVDVRAARIGGPREMLPLYVVVVKETGNEHLYIGRESFVLELPDRTTVPLASYEEFEKDYARGQADRRTLDHYLETIAGRFPEPPFSWLALDFFPRRGSGTFPRETVDLRARQLTHGFLYFRLPEDLPREGRYKLLLKPQRSEAIYVIDFPPFAEDRGR